MGKSKDARYRPWVKLRLPDNKDSRLANNVLKRWKNSRTASTFLVRAIRVYDALLRGDRNEFNSLIKNYFPGYGLVIGTAEIFMQDDDTTEVTVQVPVRTKPMTKPKVVVRAEAYDNGSDDDDDDMGFGNLNLNDEA